MTAQWISISLILAYLAYWVIRRIVNNHNRRKDGEGSGCDGCEDTTCALRDAKFRSGQQVRQSTGRPSLSEDESRGDRSISHNPGECRHKLEDKRPSESDPR